MTTPVSEMSIFSPTERVSAAQNNWEFPCQYMNTMTLIVGPEQRKYTVHLELLRDKSAVVARHLELGLRFRKGEEALMKTLYQLELIPEIDLNSVEQVDDTWLGGSFFPIDKISRFFLKPDGILSTNRPHGWEHRRTAAALFGIQTNHELDAMLHDHRWRTRHARVQLSQCFVDDLIGRLQEALADHRARFSRKTEAVDSAQDRLTLASVQPRMVEMMVHHLYTGKLETQITDGRWARMATTDLFRLWEFAKYLEMRELMEGVDEELKRRAGELPSVTEWHMLLRVAHDTGLARSLSETVDGLKAEDAMW